MVSLQPCVHLPHDLWFDACFYIVAACWSYAVRLARALRIQVRWCCLLLLCATMPRTVVSLLQAMSVAARHDGEFITTCSMATACVMLCMCSDAPGLVTTCREVAEPLTNVLTATLSHCVDDNVGFPVCLYSVKQGLLMACLVWYAKLCHLFLRAWHAAHIWAQPCRCIPASSPNHAAGNPL